MLSAIILIPVEVGNAGRALCATFSQNCQKVKKQAAIALRSSPTVKRVMDRSSPRLIVPLNNNDRMDDGMVTTVRNMV